MKALLIASVSALSLLTPVSASAAGCTWTSADLPLPANTEFSSVTGAAADGSYVLGTGTETPWREVALLWHNGSVESLPLAPGEFPNDVNASGTVLITSSDGHARRGGVELNPFPGSNYAWAAALNASGTAVGRSGGSMAIWPAGSADPRPVAGTDDTASWTVAGIDEQGRVAAWRLGQAGEPTQSYVWDEAGARTLLRPLRGYSETRVQGIRDGRVVGFSAQEHWANPVGVEWDLQGNVVRTLEGSVDATDITSSGDVLGRTDGGEVPGPSTIWRANGQVEQPPLPAVYEEFADDGSLYGWSYRSGTYTPVHARCE